MVSNINMMIVTSVVKVKMINTYFTSTQDIQQLKFHSVNLTQKNLLYSTLLYSIVQLSRKLLNLEQLYLNGVDNHMWDSRRKSDLHNTV